MNNNDKTSINKKNKSDPIGVVTILCMAILVFTQFPNIFSALRLPFMRVTLEGTNEFVGLEHFRSLFKGQFFCFFANSVLYGVIAYGSAAVLGGGFAWCLANAKNKSTVRFFSIGIQLLLVLPVVCFAYLLSMSPVFIGIGVRFVLILFLKAVPIAFLICYVAIKNNCSVGFGMLSFYLLALPFVINNNFDYGLIYPTGDRWAMELDTATVLYQTSFYMMDIGLANAMNAFVILWRLIAVWIAVPVIIRMYKGKQFQMKQTPITARSKMISVGFLVVGALLLVFMSTYKGNEYTTLSRILIYMFMFLFNSFLFCGVTLIFAYPLVYGKGYIKKSYWALLTACFLFGDNLTAEFMNAHMLETMNTDIVVMTSHIIQIPMVILLAVYVRLQNRPVVGHGAFCTIVFRPLVALGVLNFCMKWGSCVIALVYNSNPEKFAPIQSVFIEKEFMGQAHWMPICVILMMVPIFVFLIFRNFFITNIDNEPEPQRCI